MKNVEKIQIIKTNIDENRFYCHDSCNYYNKLRNKIKNSLNHDADIVLINLIPRKPLKEKWVVELLLDLQGEFTQTVILPRAEINMSTKELEDIKCFLKIKNILQSTN
ncbi:MAG: hypothetical protein APR63_06210 [Desulfuromonas sp. SDB]|nr:MAG: hypothetical protein APR63_06210 [Desulfuromonas sp. SDB]